MTDEKISPLPLQRLKKFTPLSVLSDSRLEEMLGTADIEKYNVGSTLFREGDVDNRSIFLLQGDVQLNSMLDNGDVSVINEKSEEARMPLGGGHQPRQATCTALTLVETFSIDNSVLDYMMTWDQIAAAELQQETHHAAGQGGNSSDVQHDSSANWLQQMRSIMAFKNLPAANIKSLIKRMQLLNVDKGDRLIRQGDMGDYFYVLVEGEALVTRTVELATLEAGRSFGEEALLSGGKRNASVTMKTPGQVMRLSRDDFNELLREPMLDRVLADEAQQRISQGAIWLDVRHAMEFRNQHMKGAINIPLHELRLRISELDRKTQYLCYCGTGRRSSAAAFLLAQNGFKVAVLNGGIQSLAQKPQAG